MSAFLTVLKVFGIALAAITICISTPLVFWILVMVHREEKNETGRDAQHD